MSVFLFPGQGSQAVGMAKAFFDERASVRLLFEEASDITGRNLRELCFEGPGAVLVQTENVQPAITLVNLVCLHVLREEGIEPAAAAGHSLGEYAALCAAGIFTFAETMRLVLVRGRAMQQAADRHPGGMTAIFGLDIETLSAICDEVREAGSVEVANHNSPLQVALTGEKEALRAAATLAKQKGARLVVPLKVSGAWHSRFMSEAQAMMREALDDCALAPARIPVLSNVTGEAHISDPERIRQALLQQLVSPVRWTGSMQRLIAQGHKLYLEVGPGKVLAGLMRDISKDVQVMGVQDPDSLAKCLAARPQLSA